MDTLYHEELLELYHHPLNKKTLPNATVHHVEHNPLCGDRIELYLLIEHDRIIDIGFQGSGCVLSDIGGSLLTETAKHKNLSEALAITPDMIITAAGIPHLNPTRIRCITLALESLKKGLSSSNL
jgi:nitrogen fixation NifU-like protein